MWVKLWVKIKFLVLEDSKTKSYILNFYGDTKFLFNTYESIEELLYTEGEVMATEHLSLPSTSEEFKIFLSRKISRLNLLCNFTYIEDSAEVLHILKWE